MKYRVRVKVGYHERWFEFNKAAEAMKFAETILDHQIESEDYQNAVLTVNVNVIKEGDNNE